jgi:hypothetical protein
MQTIEDHMNYKRILSSFAISFVTLLPLTSLHAENSSIIKAQRNCSSGGDLQITKNTVSAYSQCSWLANDDLNMQITLHVAKDVNFIAAHCIFSRNASDSTDKVVGVMASKSGNSAGSAAPKPIAGDYQIIKKNNIDVILRNFNNTFDDGDNHSSHLNVLFYLNNTNYTAGDQISCTFAPILAPL